MKRRVLLPVVLLVALAGAGYAQEDGRAAQKEEEQSGRLLVLKWINFGILVAGLGYLIAKNAPAFFNARSEEIQKAIQDATGLKIDADFRASEIDRRMATLGAEIQKLRDASKADMERESRRIDEETRAALARIQEHTTREVDSLRQQAALAVREHTVRLASDLAVSYLRDHPEEIDHNALLGTFSKTVLDGARA